MANKTWIQIQITKINLISLILSGNTLILHYASETIFVMLRPWQQ